MEDQAAAGQISVRRISNGYIMTYYEAVLISDEVGVGKIFRPEQREAYFESPHAGGLLMEVAVKNADDLAQGLKNLEEAQSKHPTET